MQQHKLLINRAQELGARVRDVSHLLQTSATFLDFNGHNELIVKGVPSSWISHKSIEVCDNKQLTKYAFEQIGIPAPASLVFSDLKAPEIQAFLKVGKTYVCKPIGESDGKGVKLNIKSLEEVAQYHDEYASLYDQFLLEEQVEGIDLRLHVIGGKIIAACIREPAFVVGDGQKDLASLIEDRRAEMYKQNPGNQLRIDEETQSLLSEQALSLQSIPDDNQKVKLKRVSNMAKGGRAIDVSDQIHPIFHEWAAKLATFLSSGYFGMDFLTTDYENDPAHKASIIEVNARAEWLHHTFSERRTHDIPSIILSQLFPNILD